MDGLNNGMEDKIDGIEEKLKVDMEVLKEGLTKLLQEMIPNGEKVLYETHNEKKNVNRDSIASNVGLKTQHIPKINMRKFYCKDPIT